MQKSCVSWCRNSALIDAKKFLVDAEKLIQMMLKNCFKWSGWGEFDELTQNS